MKKILSGVDIGLAKAENFLIILVLSVMVLLSFTQVLLRNFLDTGLLWGDIFLRHLVLWVGFIGASLATREEKHINIDVLTRLFSKKYQPYFKIAIDLVSIAICVILAKAGWSFVSYEMEANTILFENIPAWYLEIIIPVGFGLIGFRFLLKVLEQFTALFSDSVA